MDLFGIGTALGAIGDTVIGGLNYGLQKDAYEFQKKQQEYANKWNEYVYEDQKQQANTAVQRNVKDLEAAGMNKLLAAGGSAGTGGAVSASTVGVTPPQIEANLTEKMGQVYDTIYNMVTMNNDLATSQAQRDLIKAQTVDSLKGAGVKQSQIDSILYDLKKSMKMGIRTSDSINSTVNTAIAGTKTFMEEFNDSMEKSKQRAKQMKEKAFDGKYKKPLYEGSGGTTIGGRRYGY